MKRLIYILTLGIFATVFLVLATSCSQYTCPTYGDSSQYGKNKYNVGNAIMSRTETKLQRN